MPVVLLSALAPLAVHAQVAVHENAAGHEWFLDAGRMTYAVGVNDQGMLQSMYWGPHLPADATLPAAKMHPERASVDPPIGTTPLEYPAWGEGLFTESALKADSPNGDRTLILKYESAKTSADQLEIVLKDTAQPVRVHLYYKAFPEGVIARWSRIENSGKAPVQIEQAASATWTLPAYPETDKSSYSMRWLTGMWAGEFQLHEERVQAGERVLESRKGSTSQRANPWFAFGRTDETTETAGPVWFGELGYSGSWRIAVDDTSLHMVKVTGGYNPFDFGYQLQPGESLETPKFYAGYTDGGHGEASRVLHRFQTDEILPHRSATRQPPPPRKILFNSWEATEMTFTDQMQIALADKAAKLGVERFVVDDGWFGQRNDDHRGLGDWTVNPQKFPHGLKPLIDHVHSLGMDFGIWVEPEMVNPNSDLYRAHPEWAMQFPDRQHTEARNQLVLNLARPDVKEWMFNWLDKLVSENDIAYLKWDYNRNWTEAGWEGAPGSSAAHRNPDAEKAIYVQYVRNLYDVIDRLRAKHPKLEIESCASGGGRVDLGILERTDEVWTSDNTDALDRLDIQYGFTQAYTPQVMAAWTTDVPNYDRRFVPLQYRFLVAMQGALGIGNNLNKFSDDDMALGAKLTAFYKSIRNTVQQGDLYRLAPPTDRDATQVEYVSRDGSQAVLMAYLHSQRLGVAYPPVRLLGLDAKAMYRVRALDAAKYHGDATVSGAVLMGSGVALSMVGDYDSTAVVLERVK
ncbi:alpha-galactosidase [Terriglobus aquaticus]|uniref:Alpha-galactosidase n=1 Tax=Terriglobus aquaticus TaxID=940139 RepID=A0ABW9KFK9_9BACT|nr:alpha-galactosidase [Terriglobus aquaticus]